MISRILGGINIVTFDTVKKEKKKNTKREKNNNSIYKSVPKCNVLDV